MSVKESQTSVVSSLVRINTSHKQLPDLGRNSFPNVFEFELKRRESRMCQFWTFIFLYCLCFVSHKKMFFKIKEHFVICLFLLILFSDGKQCYIFILLYYIYKLYSYFTKTINSYFWFKLTNIFFFIFTSVQKYRGKNSKWWEFLVIFTQKLFPSPTFLLNIFSF